MEPREDLLKLVMEVDRLAVDLYRLGDRSVTELKKCVTIIAGLSYKN